MQITRHGLISELTSEQADQLHVLVTSIMDAGVIPLRGQHDLLEQWEASVAPASTRLYLISITFVPLALRALVQHYRLHLFGPQD